MWNYLTFSMKADKKLKWYFMAMVFSVILEYSIGIIETIAIMNMESESPIKRIAILVAIAIVTLVVSNVKSIIQTVAYHSSYKTFANRLFVKVTKNNMRFFEKLKDSQLENLINNLPMGLSLNMIVLDLLECIAALVTTMIIVLYVTDLKTFGIVILSILIGTLIMIVFYRKLKESSKIRKDNKNKRISKMARIANNARLVKSQNTEHQECNEFSMLIEEMKKFSYTENFCLYGYRNVISILFYAIVMIIAINKISVVFVVMANMGNILGSLRGLLSLSDQINIGKEIVEDYQEVMNQVNEDDGNINLEGSIKSIELKNVSFHYPTTDNAESSSGNVLNNISFRIESGKKYAIVGKSGCGKSTIMNLLNKFYSPTQGEIIINDWLNMSDITNHSLRERLGMVFQSSMIINDSIYNNITYGAVKNVRPEQVYAAAELAQIYSDIIQKGGFDKSPGPNGITLSGGQQQRLALARVFLKNPDIILLDEATSAQDNTNEAGIYNSIKILGNKTVVAIAHRLSSIRDFDEIIVIDEISHQVCQRGAFDELASVEGKFKELLSQEMAEQKFRFYKPGIFD